MFIHNVPALHTGITVIFLLLTGESFAQNYDPAFERAIRTAIPHPARCAITPEPLFYCRFDNAFEGSVVLELAATKEGPSASLTYEYSDPKGAELLGIVSGFFGSVGVDTKSLANCIRQSHIESSEMTVGDVTLTSRYADIGTRVTYEVFAYPRTEASPRSFLLAGSGTTGPPETPSATTKGE